MTDTPDADTPDADTPTTDRSRRTDEPTPRATDPATTAGRPPGAIARTAGKVVADLLVFGLWALFLTLVFLETAWPRWAFYVLLLLGVAGYVTVTSPWFDRAEPSA